MLNSIIISNKIEKVSTINSILYKFRRLGILKKENVSETMKKIVFICSFIMNFLFNIILKCFYLYMIYFCIRLLTGKYDSRSFVNSFILLTMYGSIINAKMLGTSKKKYHSVILLDMDCKNYVFSELLLNLISSFVFIFLAFLIMRLLDLDILTCLFLSLFVIFSKILGEVYNVIYYKFKHNVFINNTPLYFLTLLIFIALIFISISFKVFISFNGLILLDIIFFIFSIGGFIYLFKIDDYKSMYKKISNINSYVLNDGSSFTKDELVSINKGDYNFVVDRMKCNNPYQYFNDIFIGRHRSILLRPVMRDAIFIFIVGVIAVIISILNRDLGYGIGKLIMRYFMWIFLVIYSLNKSPIMTEAMFINCDRSMLQYSFYRNKGTILMIFKERLKSLIRFNLIPVSVLAFFVSLILFISLKFKLIYVLLIFITLISISILFTVHHLTVYYLFQPYDKEAKMKGFSFQIINTIVYILLFFLIKIKISVLSLTTSVILLSIIYIVLCFILVNKKAPKSFKIH